MTRLRLEYLRRARAHILDGVEVVEGCVGGMGEPLDTEAARVAVALREEIGRLTDAILIAEQRAAQKFGRLG